MVAKCVSIEMRENLQNAPIETFEVVKKRKVVDNVLRLKHRLDDFGQK